MRVQRIATKQGHPVPEVATYAKGPFPQELFQRPDVIVDYEPYDGGSETAVGGTAQNNFTAVKYFKCKDCHEVMTERETHEHICQVDNGEPS
jgi:hypothetical protein